MERIDIPKAFGIEELLSFLHPQTTPTLLGIKKEIAIFV
jgi:hypothetical protein